MERTTHTVPTAMPRVRIVVPSWFHTLPMHRDPDERRHALLALAARVLPHGDPEQRRGLAALYDRQAVELSRYQLLYYGFSYLTAGDKISTSSLLVGVEPGDHLDVHDAVERLAARFHQTAGPHQQVQRYALPCGPAVLVLAGATVPVPTRIGPEPDRAVVPVAEAQAVVPIPGAPYLLVLRLTTPSLADWPEYCQVLVSVLRSVRFEPSEAAA